MNAPRILPTAEAYALLAARVAWVWAHVMDRAVALDAARNACTWLELSPGATELVARQHFADALKHRRDVLLLRPLRHLGDLQVDYLASLALELWRAHRAEQGARLTLPAPAGCDADHPCGRCGDCDDSPSADDVRRGEERADALYQRMHGATL